ncbi:MAG: PAS domain S-box protein [Prolixibacteraceae bacterium]|jgi:PAS domain S-box-containing protein|nr:PAS domain S-box protein [Prolixibacteraceae bacterium]
MNSTKLLNVFSTFFKRGKNRQLIFFTVFSVVMWTILLGISLMFNIKDSRENIFQTVYILAETSQEKDNLFRRWGVHHGGVYVPVTDKTKPNPFLTNIPERDITTPSGKLLTLINPAFMMRQFNEFEKDAPKALSYFTSLNPLRPENAPDKWERKALEIFETGNTEFSGIDTIDGLEYYRLMRPLVTETSCLKCHAHQGYVKGDIRGGIGMAIPMKPYKTILKGTIQRLSFLHLIVWILGLSGVVFGYISLTKSDKKKSIAEAALIQLNKDLEHRVKERSDELEKTEKRFRSLIEKGKDIITLLDKTGKIKYTSPSNKTCLGYSNEEYIGTDSFGYIHPQDLEKINRHYANILTKPGKYVQTEFRIRHKDGTYIWFEAEGTNRLDDPSLESLVSISRDITVRKKAEEEIKNANRVYAVLSNINKAIVKVKDRQSLFNETCRVSVEDGNFKMSWIAIADQQTNKIISQASAGFTEDYINNVHIDLNDEKGRQSPIGQVITTGVHYLANDIANNPDMNLWRENALRLGYKSSAAFPIKVSDKTIGAYLLYSDEAFFFDEKEVELLDSLAMDISFAIEFIETETKRNLIEKQRSELSDRFTKIAKQIPVVIYQYCLRPDGSSYFPYSSEGIFKIYGVTPEEVIENADPVFKVLHPDDLERVGKKINESAKNLKPWNDQYRVNLPSGKTIWVEGDAIPQKLKDGSILWHGYINNITKRKRSEQIQKVLYNISIAAISSDNLKKLLGRIKEEIGIIIDTGNFYVALYDKKDETLSLPYFSDEKDEFRTVPAGKTLSQYVIDTKKSLLANIGLKEKLVREGKVEHFGTLSKIWLGVPLKIADDVIGVLAVQNYDNEFAYDESDMKMLEFISDQISQSIQRKRAEDEIASLQKYNRGLIEASIDPWIIFNTKGIITDVNTATEKAVGLSRAELLNTPFADYFTDNKKAQAGAGQVFEKGKVKDYELVLIAKDKTETEVSYNATVYTNQNGDIVGAFAAARDITKHKNIEGQIRDLNANLELKVKERTVELEKLNKNLFDENIERKRAEEAAYQSEKIRSLQFNNSPIGMLLCRMDGSFVDINPACTNIIGRTVEESLKLTYWDLTPQKYEQQEGEQLKSLEETGRYGPYIKEYIHKNGHLVPVELSGLILEINNERFIWSSVQDITKRLKAENEIKTAKLEAEQANLAKSEFLSRMSHELRTPMNSILGFAQLMGMGQLNPPQKRGVDHIMKSGKHLLDLINEVLDLSRIEAGKLKLMNVPVKLSSIITETLDIVQNLASGKNISIGFVQTKVSMYYVLADNQKLKQILINLVNNAIKYNHDGGSVSIECSESLVPGSKLTRNPKPETPNSEPETMNSEPGTPNPEPETHIRINIKDTGKGISPESVEKLFTPFQRIGAELSEVEGTGLGLTVAKKLVEAMHGTIGVESTVGVGSTFWVELPQTKSQTEIIEKGENLGKSKTPEKEKKGLVLYIEDNASNIELIEQILETYNPEIVLVTETFGKRAVKHANDYKPDLIFLDLDLPDLHGSKVFERLQADDNVKDIPVVIVSADALTKQIDKLIKQGAKDYLTKPIDVVQFLKVVEEYLGGK